LQQLAMTVMVITTDTAEASGAANLLKYSQTKPCFSVLKLKPSQKALSVTECRFAP
jgi:hypothetical protein